MPAPHEIVAGPLELWAAPVGTAFPAITATPSGDWVKVGTSGAKNYDDEGVTATLSQTIEGFTPAGGTHQRKAFRTDDGLAFACNVVDFSPEQFALLHDRATITTVAAGAGVAGTKTIPLGRDIEVELYAILARGMSPVNNALPAQFQASAAYQNGEQELVFQKGEPVGVAVEFVVVEATAGSFADLVVQTAAPTS